MKIFFEHHNVRTNDTLHSAVEQQIGEFTPALKIDEAQIELVHQHHASPPYVAKAHLVTPGPDVFAEGRDHTLQAALHKMMNLLRAKIGSRATRRQKRQRNYAPALRPC